MPQPQSSSDALRTVASPCVAIATCLAACVESSLNKSRVVRHAKKLEARAAERAASKQPPHDTTVTRAPAQSLGGGAVRDSDGRVWMAGPSDTWLTRMHDGRWIHMNSDGSVRLAEPRELEAFRSVQFSLLPSEERRRLEGWEPTPPASPEVTRKAFWAWEDPDGSRVALGPASSSLGAPSAWPTRTPHASTAHRPRVTGVSGEPYGEHATRSTRRVHVAGDGGWATELGTEEEDEVTSISDEDYEDDDKEMQEATRPMLSRMNTAGRGLMATVGAGREGRRQRPAFAVAAEAFEEAGTRRRDSREAAPTLVVMPASTQVAMPAAAKGHGRARSSSGRGSARSEGAERRREMSRRRPVNIDSSAAKHAAEVACRAPLYPPFRAGRVSYTFSSSSPLAPPELTPTWAWRMSSAPYSAREPRPFNTAQLYEQSSNGARTADSGDSRLTAVTHDGAGEVGGRDEGAMMVEKPPPAPPPPSRVSSAAFGLTAAPPPTVSSTSFHALPVMDPSIEAPPPTESPSSPPAESPSPPSEPAVGGAHSFSEPPLTSARSGLSSARGILNSARNSTPRRRRNSTDRDVSSTSAGRTAPHTARSSVSSGAGASAMTTMSNPHPKPSRVWLKPGRHDGPLTDALVERERDLTIRHSEISPDRSPVGSPRHAASMHTGGLEALSSRLMDPLAAWSSPRPKSARARSVGASPRARTPTVSVRGKGSKAWAVFV